MKILDDYLKLQKEIYEYFGYVEDWCVFPIDDRRDQFWTENGDEVYYSPRKDVIEELVKVDEFGYSLDWEKIPEEMQNFVYSDDIYPNRFLPTAEYRGKDFSMILVNTNTDGNKFLAIYDNKKEVKEQTETTNG